MAIENASPYAAGPLRSPKTAKKIVPNFEALISALREGSPKFDRWWDLHEVARSGVGRKTIKHPSAGKLHFEHAVFKLEETPEQRLVLYTPVGETERKMERLLGEAG
jgi:MmyB-like transcription regulator ligand binding domain